MYNFQIVNDDETSVHSLVKHDWNDKGIYSLSFKEKIKYGRCVGEGYHRHYVLATYNDEIVGICKFKIGGEDSICDPGFCNWLDFISVDPDHQGKGISGKLLEMMFDYLIANNQTHFLSSGYTQMGYDRVRVKMRTLAEKHNINFKDDDEVSF